MISIDLGESIPPHTAHAVSVSLPTWEANVAYEEGKRWVVDRMVTGYPRFFVHRSIDAFAQDIVRRFVPAELAFTTQAMLFPTKEGAARCLAFVKARCALPAAGQPESRFQVLGLVLDETKPETRHLVGLHPAIAAFIFPDSALPCAKQYWQHTGDGISSRRAEFCHGLLKSGLLGVEGGDAASTAGASVGADTSSRPCSPTSPGGKPCRGPKRYQRPLSLDGTQVPPSPQPIEPPARLNNGSAGDAQESARFLEERFGRNLDLGFIEPAKSAVRRRIAGALTADASTVDVEAREIPPNARGVSTLREDDVYLFPCGMNAIFHSHRALLAARGAYKSVSFGFPYVDTLKILQKFGPGCIFYGHASESDLDDLEARLRGGEQFLGLFCEFPGNPLLTCPNLTRIRSLADEFGFAVVVDETIGTFANINVLPFADIVASSLTKIFSGDCNVMGGSAILNPEGRYYAVLKEVMARQYQDTYWAEDVVFMERNSRDFASRVDRINTNAEATCRELVGHPLVRHVHYPKHNESRPNYDRCKLPRGGYGGLLSVVFHSQRQAAAFYDAINTAKGPSLGANFTLTSPYVILAHYNELEWAAGLGVDPNLVRISVGLEETDSLVHEVRSALQAAALSQSSSAST